jgi:CRISPR/Cas system-associated exonuclease Cas4 (RecB family)
MARSRALISVLNLVQEQELPVEKQFLQDLNSSIEREDVKNARKPSQTYKPSSLHCIRNMEYQVMGVEGQSDRASSELIGICESGSDRHERIQNAIMKMKDNDIDCEYLDVAEYIKTHNLSDIEVVAKQGNETKLYHKKYNMSFLTDGLIRYKGHYYIFEYKTETDNKFWGHDDVQEEHKLQGTAYSLAFNINNVIFVYENRNTCNKKAYMLKVTEKMREELKHKIETCNEYLSKGQIVPKPENAGKKLCAYCGYAERCKLDG